MIPYRLALPIACVVLAIAYALDRDASLMWRIVVGLIAIATIVAPVPNELAWQITVILTQLAISLFVLIRRIARRA